MRVDLVANLRAVGFVRMKCSLEGETTLSRSKKEAKALLEVGIVELLLLRRASIFSASGSGTSGSRWPPTVPITVS